ncbi:MAG: hypothetical protein ACWGQW_11985 [bacterium]
MTDNPANVPETAGGETPPAQTTPAQQPPANPQSTPVGDPPAGFVEKARFDGLVRKVEELTLTNRSLQEQLTAKSSEVEQLKGDLQVKDTEKTVAVGERDKSLQTSMEENQRLQAEVSNLQAMKLKLEVAKELKRPELVNILDTLPNLTDKEALKTVAQDMLRFADDLVVQREKQLTSGITPEISSVSAEAALPSTPQSWENHINALPLGSPERKKAMDDYGDWLETKNTLQ